MLNATVTEHPNGSAILVPVLDRASLEGISSLRAHQRSSPGGCLVPGFVIHKPAVLTTCSLLLVLNYMNVGVFHPGKLPRITGVLWKMLSEAHQKRLRLGYPRKGASQASWSRQGAVSWAGKGYSTS